MIDQQEKKVEYLELIYDLIFVYIIGRNNSLLHLTENGTISLSAFISYVVCTLDVIQIWNFSTYYINIYGKIGLREHIFLFSNMFLLYFIGVGTQEHWQKYHTPNLCSSSICREASASHVSNRFCDYRNHHSHGNAILYLLD